MRQKFVTIVAMVCLHAATLDGQSQPGTLRVHVREAEKPVQNADVVITGLAHQTNASGVVEIQVPQARWS